MTAGGGPEELPVGATLLITPEEQIYTVPDRRDENGACTVDPNLYVDLPLLLALREGRGAGGSDDRAAGTRARAAPDARERGVAVNHVAGQILSTCS